MILASTATIMSALVSIARPASVLVTCVGHAITFMAFYFGCLASAVPVKALQGAKSNIVSNIFAESQAQLEAAYTDEEENEVSEGALLVGTAAGGVSAAALGKGQDRVDKSAVVRAQVILSARAVMKALGSDEYVSSLLLRDLEDASGLSRSSFVIEGTRTSDNDHLIFDIAIYSDPSLPNISTRLIADELRAQAKDPFSRLRSSKATSFVQDVRITSDGPPFFQTLLAAPFSAPSPAAYRNEECNPVPQDNPMGSPLGSFHTSQSDFCIVSDEGSIWPPWRHGALIEHHRDVNKLPTPASMSSSPPAAVQIHLLSSQQAKPSMWGQSKVVESPREVEESTLTDLTDSIALMAALRDHSSSPAASPFRNNQGDRLDAYSQVAPGIFRFTC